MLRRPARFVVAPLVLLAALVPGSPRAADLDVVTWSPVESPTWTDSSLACEESGGVWADANGNGVFDEGECMWDDPHADDLDWDWDAFSNEDVSASAIAFATGLAKALRVPVVYVVGLDRKGVVRSKFAIDGSTVKPTSAEIRVLVVVGKTRYDATRVGGSLLDSAAAPRFVRRGGGLHASVGAGVLARVRHRLLAVTNATDVVLEVKEGRLIVQSGTNTCR